MKNAEMLFMVHRFKVFLRALKMYFPPHTGMSQLLSFWAM